MEGHIVGLPLPLGIEGHGAPIGGRQVQGLFHSFPGAVGLGVPAGKLVSLPGEGAGGQFCCLAVEDPLLVRHLAGALVGVEADGVGDGGPAGNEFRHISFLNPGHFQLIPGIPDQVIFPLHAPSGKLVSCPGVAALGENIAFAVYKIRHILDAALAVFRSGKEAGCVGAGPPLGIESHGARFCQVLHLVPWLIALALSIRLGIPAGKGITGVNEGGFRQGHRRIHGGFQVFHAADLGTVAIESDGVAPVPHKLRIQQRLIAVANSDGLPLFLGTVVNNLFQISAVVKGPCSNGFHSVIQLHRGKAAAPESKSSDACQALRQSQLAVKPLAPPEGLSAECSQPLRKSQASGKSTVRKSNFSDVRQVLRQDQRTCQFLTAAEGAIAHARQAIREFQCTCQARATVESRIANMGDSLLQHQLLRLQRQPGGLLLKVIHCSGAGDGQSARVVQLPGQIVTTAALCYRDGGDGDKGKPVFFGIGFRIGATVALDGEALYRRTVEITNGVFFQAGDASGNCHRLQALTGPQSGVHSFQPLWQDHFRQVWTEAEGIGQELFCPLRYCVGAPWPAGRVVKQDRAVLRE